MNLQEALNEIHFQRGYFPDQALSIIEENAKEATPHLLKELQQAIKQHKKLGDYYTAHLFALLLLAKFREKKAFPLVLELLNWPDQETDRIFGDMFTESIGPIVLSVFDGNAEPLFQLFDREDIDPLTRIMLGDIFVLLVHHHKIEKEKLTTFLFEAVASNKHNEDFGFYTALADIVKSLKLTDLYDVVRAAYKLNLIDTNYLSKADFEHLIHEPIEKIYLQKHLNPVTDIKEHFFHDGEVEVRTNPKIDPDSDCPCGSGKKFHSCCLSKL